MMKLISSIKELYTGEDLLYKHLSLACISGLISLLSDKDFVENLISQNNHAMAIAGVIATIIGSLYLYGYVIEVIHFRLQTGIIALPELDTKPFGRILSILPLLLLWGFYFLIFIVLMIIPIIFKLFPITIVMFIAYIIFTLFVPFIFIAYAKNFQTFGLTNITLPFTFMKLAFVDLFLTVLKFCLLYIVIIIPIGLLGMILIMINSTVGFALAASIIGYMSFIMTLVWYNALAEIYIDKLDMEIEELY